MTKRELKQEIDQLRNDMAEEFVKRDKVIEAHTIHLEAFHKLIYGWAKDLGEIMRRMETLEGAAKADLPKKEEYVAPEVKAEDPTLFAELNKKRIRSKYYKTVQAFIRTAQKDGFTAEEYRSAMDAVHAIPFENNGSKKLTTSDHDCVMKYLKILKI